MTALIEAKKSEPADLYKIEERQETLVGSAVADNLKGLEYEA